jgi:hypothetical protein
MAVNNMDGWENISSHRTQSDSAALTVAAKNYYGLSGKRVCQVLGVGTLHVVNAHIWPESNRKNLVLVELEEDDVNNARNILRLHHDIERAFDHKRLTFTTKRGATAENTQFELKVLDPDLMATTLADTGKTFADVDGLPLVFPTGRMPYRRNLATHSVLAYRFARNQGWLQIDALTEGEVTAGELIRFSLDEEAQQRLHRFLDSIPSPPSSSSPPSPDSSPASKAPAFTVTSLGARRGRRGGKRGKRRGKKAAPLNRGSEKDKQ